MDKMTIDFILRILVAALLGGMVGLEREYRDKAAGFRTHFLVALGSALFMIISAYGFSSALVSTEHRLDVSRVAAQVVSGIGFIGAGTIIFQKNAVRGLTTAASIWVTAAIGLACGAGMYILAAAATLFVLLGLEAFNFFLRRFDHHRNEKLPTTIIIMCMLMAPLGMLAQAPVNYYRMADGKCGAELKTALYQIIKNPNVVEYASLWTAYQTSDAIPTDTVPIIWDMYSCNSHYSIYTTLHQNGKYGTDPEGTRGFQREHSMPKSWFNPAAKSGSSFTYKDIWPMYSDLVHVIPAEGIVNNKRSNNPYGTNNGEWYKSEPDPNDPEQKPFSKMGACTYSTEYTGRCFEPNDEYKGDIARIYFYMVTAYEQKQPTWSSTTEGVGDHCGTWTGPMFNLEDDDPYQPFTNWAFNMLMEWSKNDPVSQKEIDRNEACYQLQGNRNPFVDYPGLENYIWGELKDTPFDDGEESESEETIAQNCEFVLNNTTFSVDWKLTEEHKAELKAAEEDWTQYENFRDYYERTPLVVENNGITMIFNYGICGKNMYADTDKIRLYNYNTLSFKAANNKISRIEFTLGERNHEDKKLKAFVGNLDDNVWTGEEEEVLFTTDYVTSKYNSGTKTTTHYYLELTDVKIEVSVASGICQQPTVQMPSDAVYTLSGVRVDGAHLRPGVYIKNGKKFFVK